jgi:hypothetical protein
MNPKVTGRENEDFMLQFKDLYDLGVLKLCFRCFERVILNFS